MLQLFYLWHEIEKTINAKLIGLAEEIWNDVKEGEMKDNLDKYEHSSEEEKFKIVEKVSDLARKTAIAFIDKNK